MDRSRRTPSSPSRSSIDRGSALVPEARSAPARRSAIAALSTDRFQGSSCRSAASRRSASSDASAERSPPTEISPSVALPSPATSSSSVDFPQPEGPTSADGLALGDREVEAGEDVDVAEPMRQVRGSRSRLPLGDDVLPFARITAQVRRVSAGRGVPETLSQPASREHPLTEAIIAGRADPLGPVRDAPPRRRSARGVWSSSTRTPRSRRARRRPSPSRRSSSRAAARD